MRVDKWLWAARLVKTRGIGADAVKAGRVQVNGKVIKPSRALKPGDRLELRHGEVRRTVIVRELSERRGPAKVAELLYEETPESVEARAQHAAQKRIEAALRPKYDDAAGRPTKRDRRRLEQARRSERLP